MTSRTFSRGEFPVAGRPGAGCGHLPACLVRLEARLIDVTVLDDAAGVALLDAALRAARPEDDLISGDAEKAGRLAWICGGLPLALQIAAALLKADPVLAVIELGSSERGWRPCGTRMTAALALCLSTRHSSYPNDSFLTPPARVFRMLPLSLGPDLSTDSAVVLVGTGGRWRTHELVRLYAQRLSDEHADTDGRASKTADLCWSEPDSATGGAPTVSPSYRHTAGRQEPLRGSRSRGGDGRNA